MISFLLSCCFGFSLGTAIVVILLREDEPVSERVQCFEIGYGATWVSPAGGSSVFDGKTPRSSAPETPVSYETVPVSRAAPMLEQHQPPLAFGRPETMKRGKETYRSSAISVPTFRALTVCKSAERAENLRRLRSAAAGNV